MFYSKIITKNHWIVNLKQNNYTQYEVYLNFYKRKARGRKEQDYCLFPKQRYTRSTGNNLPFSTLQE